MIRPSSLPFLQQCALWESDQSAGVEDKDAGHNRHAYLAALLRCHLSGNDVRQFLSRLGLDNVGTDDRDGVEWAASYILTHAPTSSYPLRIEYRVNPRDADFNPIFPNGGTLDAACGNELFDFKWRERDYAAQMAAYALDLFQEHDWPEVKVHVLFGESKRAEVCRLDEAGAQKIVYDIVRRVTDPESKPTPCQYCGWCARRLTCPAVTSAVATVAHGYSDLDRVKSWHPSAMESGEELSGALWIWRTVLKPWGESIEFHALAAAQKKGLTLPGFELKSKSGKAYVPDVVEAFKLSGLPQEDFLRGCQVRLNTSKKYPDQLGLVDIYGRFHGIKPTPAKKDLLKRLESVVKRTKDSQYLKAVKTDAADEESEEGE